MGLAAEAKDADRVIEVSAGNFSRKEERALAVIPQAGALTPMAMIAEAVRQGMGLETIKELRTLQKEWEADEARKAFGDAMAAFKLSPPSLRKNKQVSYERKDGGITAYKHATLDEVAIAIGNALAPHGLKHSWDVKQKDGGMIDVTCTLSHRQGHSESVTLSAGRDDSGSKNNIQALGSTITYLQRYTLLAVTGMAVKGQDDDGRGSEGDDKRGLSEQQFADFEAKIEEFTDATALGKFWKVIVKACNEAKDVESCNALKAKVAAKGTSLKKGKAK